MGFYWGIMHGGCSKDIVLVTVAEIIQKQELNHSQKPYIPRGLINRGNWCYINAVSFRFNFSQQETFISEVQVDQVVKAVIKFLVTSCLDLNTQCNPVN